MARILITSALPYINGIKHLGNLAGSMLQIGRASCRERVS
jgi:methionyl-tRNA synthetase